MNPIEILKQINTAKTHQEVAKLYDKWAKTYDTDLQEIRPGNLGAAYTVDMFEKYVHHEGMILDAGAGTGGVGELLHHRGFSNLVGLDISSGMLYEAKKKNVYTDLRVGILGEELDFKNDTFDAVISVGLFTLEHPPPPSSFDELIRLTKQGGHIVFLLNNNLTNEFKRKMNELEAEGKWEIVETSKDFFPVPKGQPHPGLRIFIYQTL